MKKLISIKKLRNNKENNKKEINFKKLAKKLLSWNKEDFPSLTMGQTKGFCDFLPSQAWNWFINLNEK